MIRGRWRRDVSLRRRLLAGMLALVAVGLVALGLITYVTLQHLLIRRSTTAIETTTRAAVVALNALHTQTPSASPDQIRTALAPLLVNGSESLVWIPTSGDPVVVSPYLSPTPPPIQNAVDQQVLAEVDRAAGVDQPPAPVQPQSRADSLDPPNVYQRKFNGKDYQVATERTPTGTLGAIASLSELDNTLGMLMAVEAVVGGVLLLLLAGIGVLVVRRGLRPLETIVATAGAITRGDRGQRIPLAGGDTEVGRVAAALNQMLDETESSFAAQQDSEDRLRQFIADASHELRTPLATVRSYAELLRTGAASSPEDQALAMNRIESESARMSELVEDLLLLARLDMGRPLRSEPVELAALVRDAVEDENAVDPSRRRTLVITGDTWVSGDANRLRQVLMNLLTNARVHTPAGTPVEIALEGPLEGSLGGPLGGQDGGVVRITVADHGPGLSEEQAGRVFERFYRADTARTHRSGGGSGVGLGLSIVAAIVTAHQGTVHVDGGSGQGARFTVVLPAGVTSNSRSTP